MKAKTLVLAAAEGLGLIALTFLLFASVYAVGAYMGAI